MDEAVLEVEQVDAGAGGESEVVEQAEGVEKPETPENPYESKAAREFAQWLKGKRDSGDPLDAKFARIAKDAFSGQYELRKDFERGLDGVRELKTLVDSVIHTDPERGELRGPEAIAALQDTVRDLAEIDQKIAAGDASALDSFDDSMKAGIVKMAPAILDMAKQTDPEGYAAAVLPHFVQALAQSDLVKNFNSLVDVLNEAPPAWLTADQKTHWTNDRLQRVMTHAGGMGAWFNAQQEKAKGAQPGPTGQQPGVKKDTLSERETQFNQREQDHHWNTNISPKLDQHAAQSFQKLFQPFAKRLNLDQPTAKTLQMEFSKRVASAAVKDKAYVDQLKRYRGMRNPDPATVLNFAKVHFDKNAKTVMESLVNERYKPFLNGSKRVAPPAAKTGAGPAPAIGVQTVTVRPADSSIDFKHPNFINLRHQNKFPLTNGKIVQLRA
jgi:hypothetical protein